MSITAFKKKSIINYGSKRSGRTHNGYWLPQGPFGHSKTGLQLAIQNQSANGFSINGPTRNVGYIGKSYSMSKSGTPYRGTEPIGWGGKYGNYPSSQLKYHNSSRAVQPVLNVGKVHSSGTQYLYVKPSVLSTKGMLSNKYRRLYYGTYPNNWVQPLYTGNQTDTGSQGLYIQSLASANTCTLDTNNVGTYEGNVSCNNKSTPQFNKEIPTAGLRYNDIARNTRYTKNLYQPTNYTHYNLHITRGCNNPLGEQKPFPYAKHTGSGLLTGGTNSSNVGNACNTSNNYLHPPEWYTRITSNPNVKRYTQTTPFVSSLVEYYPQSTSFLSNKFSPLLSFPNMPKQIKIN